MNKKQNMLLRELHLNPRKITEKDRELLPGLHYCEEWDGMVVWDGDIEAEMCHQSCGHPSNKGE